MSVTAKQIGIAEDLSSRLEEALRHIYGAIEELEGVADPACKAMVIDLRQIASCAQDEKSSYDETLAIAEEQEIAYLNRAYERSVS